MGGQSYENMDMPKGSSNAISLDRLYPQIFQAQNKLEKYNIILNGKIEEMELLHTHLRGLQGQDYKVIRLKDIDGYTHFKIAEELNISVRTVDRIIARVKREKEGG